MSEKDIAIKVHDLHKSFDLAEHRVSSLKQAFVALGKRHKKKRQPVLNGLDFEIKKGEFFGIIGRNGNGKSTLLKLLAGVYSPDSGAVIVNGQLTPFIELGVGFNPELTGRDNVFLSASLLGFTHKQVEMMYADIVEFAELEEHMDKKLKNYSSGMQVRLAFSIAIRSDSDILLIDEVLAVGDSNFQKKCINVFKELKERGKTIVFVSHSMGYIRDFCDRVLVIESGEIVHYGSVEKGIDLYNKLNSEIQNEHIEQLNLSNQKDSNRYGNGQAEIVSYRFINRAGKKISSLDAGKNFVLEIDIMFHADVKHPAIGAMFRSNKHDNLFGINTYFNKLSISSKKKGDKLKARVEGIMPLAKGEYFLSLSVSDAESANNYVELDLLDNDCIVNISGEDRWGLLEYEAKMEIINE